MNQPEPAKGPPQRLRLDGRYCRLEPIGPQHAKGLFAATCDAEAARRYRYLLSDAPATLDDMRLRCEAASVSHDPLAFAVVDRATGQARGQQSLMRITPEHGVVEIGGVLWGEGLARTRMATEAVYLFARYVFDELGYRRFEWKCHDHNLPSKRAAQRFGFRFEGVFRQHMIVKGENRDTAWFAMLDRDWAGLRGAYEAWLEPGNFDAAGRQRERLIAGDWSPAPRG